MVLAGIKFRAIPIRSLQCAICPANNLTNACACLLTSFNSKLLARANGSLQSSIFSRLAKVYGASISLSVRFHASESAPAPLARKLLAIIKLLLTPRPWASRRSWPVLQNARACPIALPRNDRGASKSALALSKAEPRPSNALLAQFDLPRLHIRVHTNSPTSRAVG